MNKQTRSRANYVNSNDEIEAGEIFVLEKSRRIVSAATTIIRSIIRGS
jgi:hypothetical protein